MAARHVLGLVTVLCASLAVTGAEAAKKKAGKAPPPVAVGCVHPVAPFCVGVTSGKSTYALLDANPFIPLGTGVTVWGKVTSVSPCGPAITVTAWKHNRLKCKAS